VCSDLTSTFGAATAVFFTTLGSDFLVVTEAFVASTLVGALAGLATGLTTGLTALRTVLAAALLVAPTALLTFAGGAVLAVTLLVFETTLLVVLFADFAAAAIFGFAAALAGVDFVATLPAFAGERDEAGRADFAADAAVFPDFLVAFAIGLSTRWVANAAKETGGLWPELIVQRSSSPVMHSWM